MLMRILIRGASAMKRNAWNKPHAEEMRQRFLNCGIAVNNLQSEEGEGGLVICPNPSRFDCRATLHYPRYTLYTLSLRLLSDNSHRVISAFRITSEWEKEIRVLQPFEPVPQKYVDWDPEEKILNNCVGQAIGRTRCREGLLLAEGLKIPATNGRALSASITVLAYDQFDGVYSQIVSVEVVGLADLMKELKRPRRARESVFAPFDVLKKEATSVEGLESYRTGRVANEGKSAPSSPGRRSAFNKDDGPEKTR
jgi:hypothetical protein